MSNSDGKAKHLLQLELDCRTHFRELVREILSGTDWRWELSGLGQTRSQQTRDLLKQSF